MRLPASAVRNDFAHYYVASRLFLERSNPYATPLEPAYAAAGFVFRSDVPTVTNPPGLLWLFAPFALLPPRVAFWVWVAVETASLAAILWMTRRLLSGRLTTRAWWFVMAATLSSSSVYWHFQYSQVQLLLAALVLAGYAWQRSGHQMVACLAVAVAGVIKLYPLVLLPWFIWGTDGSAHARLRRTAATVMFSVAAVAAMGPGLWRGFFQSAMPFVTSGALNHSFNFTVPSLITNLGLAAYGFAPPAAVARWWSTTGVAAGLALIGLAYALSRRAKGAGEAQFCLLCVVMLAGCVTSWGHYLVFLVFPVTVAAMRLKRRVTGTAVVWFGSVLAALNWQGTMASPFLDRHLPLKVLANSLPLGGLLALLVFFVSELWQGRNNATVLK
jgi:hypothetical protein